MRSMGKLIAVTIAVLIAALVITHWWSDVENTREDKARIEWQADTAGQRNPPAFSYDRALPAEQPILFPVGLAAGVFVVGLLVIIASNSSADRR